MKVTSLITEYNPFHNGHIYHINESCKVAGADIVIAVMSGNFTQRGEAAITNKFIRAAHAVKHVDLVVELPLKNSISFADDFALGGVRIAELLGSTHLVFGSESGDISLLKQLYADSRDNVDRDELASLIRQGYSHPRALAELLGEGGISGSNNILGLSYIRAIETLGSSIIPLTIKRQSSQYNDPDLSKGAFSSATSIRNNIMAGSADAVKNFMPPDLADDILENKPLSNADFFQTLKTIITHKSPGELREIYMMTEGLEHRLKSNVRGAPGYNEFMHRIKTKRYTWTRLNRLMICILLNITKSGMAAHDVRDINAVRVLAMNRAGQKYLKTLKSTDVQIITNVNKENSRHISDEIMATDVYNIAWNSDRNDFNTPVIINR
ncbi:MAG TPA: nucleotidyltransferase [Candidatus Salinicoccus merdavium]|nr:nucleotidyltransferase [Candidatus Salinicoccus merdavium]